MKLLPFLVTGLLAASALARADDYRFKEPFSQTAPFNATGAVSLSNINGDVTVQTWDKNEILIEGEKSAKTEEELKLIDLKIDVSPSSANLQVRLPKRSGGFFGGNSIRAAVRFKLTVPVTAVLDKIETVNSSVTLDGVRGTVHAETVNGGIRATGLGGDTHLETVNGSIKAAFCTIAAQQRFSFNTVNGQVVVRLPKDAGFELHSSTVNGHVDCDFPLELGRKHHGHSLSGKVGDGRASLDVETVNGSIHLESD